MRLTLRLPVVVLLLFALAGSLALGISPARASEADIDPLDWPFWRGPEHNGISRETGIIDTFDPTGEGPGSKILWKRPDLGSISTPIVMRGKLYTVVRADAGTPRDGEKVVCLDAATGKTIWENKYNIFLSDVPAERIGWANCTGDPTTGNVYVNGANAYFQCLDGATGKTLWKHSLNEEYGFLTTYGGRLTTPVIFEDLVIVTGVIIGWGDTARPTQRVLAFDKQSGELVWIRGTRPLPEDTTYSVPALTILNGQAAMVFGSGDGGVHAWQPRTGKPIWNFSLSLRGLNVSPLVDNNRVYMGHAEENLDPTKMGAIVCIDGSKTGDITQTGEIWRQAGMVGKSSPVLLDGRLYICDDGAKMYVIDAESGKLIGNKPVKLVGTIMRASPLYADGKLYVCTTSAWHVFQPTANGVKPVGRPLRLPAEDEVAGSPIVSHGRLYLPTTSNLYCLGEADAKPHATPRPEPLKETAGNPGDKPAWVQVVPAEVLLKPGTKQKFEVRLFNARGQRVKNGNVSFSLNGPGEISKEGMFLAASDTHHTATILTAKLGDLQGQARIRVVPELPWKFDFENGEIPVPWVGARYRHVVRDVDGNKVMVKLTTVPKGQRSQAIMGPPDLHDYTIQADVLGTLVSSDGHKTNKLPDAGVIAQRYTMDLMGDHQEIQIRSWTSLLGRFSKTVPFKWDPDTWYTMKFHTQAKDGKAILKGKVWKRGEAEPEAWTIEAVDEAPNLVGSPGLFGNASVSEVLIDNVSVTKNKPE